MDSQYDYDPLEGYIEDPFHVGGTLVGDILPGLTLELLEALEAEFPPRTPGLTDSEREIFYYAGHTDLVKRLRREWDAAVELENQRTHQTGGLTA